MEAKGQALVELAVTLPFLLFAMLAYIEYGFLRAQKDHQDRETSVIAVYASQHPGESWNSAVPPELAACDIAVMTAQSIVTARTTCHYEPQVTRGLWQGIPMTSEEHAAEVGP